MNNFLISIYIKIIEQSKKKIFFEKFLIPNNFNSRLEIVELNLIIILWYMKTVDLKKSELKSIINFFIEDLEYLLRESGESESRVPKKIRNLVENFYGRLVSYSKEFDKITKSKGEKLELNLINNFNSNKVKYSFVEEYIKKNVKYFQKLKKSDFISLNFDFVF